ncbi:MAG: hypothetical protein EBS19_14420 [Spirochaetia bacterium]|nr:hypothetical protein [Spirochaetia bacterium]
MNNKKAYIIKGSEMSDGSRREWVESITISRNRAEKIKNNLNRSLIIHIEKGKEISDLYLKDKNPDIPWENMEFHTEKMNWEEFDFFCSYRYRTKLPFRIEEVNLD